MNHTIDRTRPLFAAFAPITLAALNAKAAMLERLDNKYVVRERVLREALAGLAQHFDVLEIDGKRAFTYETCYFDDDALHSYYDHHQGRRRRCKVRVRKYTDAQLCFVEVKLKDKRGITVKKRFDYTVDKYGTLDEQACAHVDEAYRAQYGEPFRHTLQPVIEMRYQRVTLVAREGGERMTIDSRLLFRRGERQRMTPPDVFIVETKSAKGNGIADKIMRALHQHPISRCSKYCVGMAAMEAVERHNKFLPALRKLEVEPRRQPAAALAPSAAQRPVQRPARRPLRRLAGVLSIAAALAAPLVQAAEREELEPLAVAATLRVVGAAVDGERISELSGLAWDADEQRLYAVSDRGVLFRFSVALGANGQLEVEPIAASRLAPPPGGGAEVDAEGLAVTGADDGVKGNSELLVSTEGQPRVIRYTLAGQPLGILALPGGLDDPARFRRDNAMLEAVAMHPAHGLLVAAEAPLEGERVGHHRVVGRERAWSFPSHPARNARLKGMEVMDDGRLLVLERAESGKGKGKTLMVVLREVDLAACAEGQVCPVRELAVLDRPDEADNFEGLAHLGEGRVMIVSDDRGKSGRGTSFTVLQPRPAGGDAGYSTGAKP